MTTNVRAVVLAREDWREHDALITLYTRERGKVEAVARGLRKNQSKLAAHLEPLVTTEAFLVHGRRWMILAGSVVEDARLALRQDLERLTAASAVVRFADLATPLESRDERFFDLLDETLSLAATRPLTPGLGALLPAMFAWKALTLSGYRPNLAACHSCGRRVDVGAAELNLRHGVITHVECRTTEQVLKLPTVRIKQPTLKGLAYMAEAPIADTFRLRASAVTFDEMSTVVSALAEERFERAIGLL